MGDGIAKGVGEQLGELGKQVVAEVAQVPAKIAGLDAGSTNETVGAGTGGNQSGQQKQQKAQINEQKRIAEVARKDEMQKEQQLAQARRLLQQFINPAESPEQPIKEKLDLEELEKKKKEIAAENEKAKKQLPKTGSKRPRGDLYGTRAKQFTGETGKNVKAQ